MKGNQLGDLLLIASEERQYLPAKTYQRGAELASEARGVHSGARRCRGR
jgi:hypothetical protein